MKSLSIVLVICLVVPSFLSAQAEEVPAPGISEGTKLGNIISTVIGIALPPLQQLVEKIFPPKTRDCIKKSELEARLKSLEEATKNEIREELRDIGAIVSEVDCLREFLDPCIEVQDLLREIIGLVAKSPISSEDWAGAQSAWGSVKALVGRIKEIDLDRIRNRSIRLEFLKIQNMRLSTMNRYDRDYFLRSAEVVGKPENAILLRHDMADLLKLYQTVQLILGESLLELKMEFDDAARVLEDRGTVKSLGEPEEVSPARLKITKRLRDVMARIERGGPE